MFNIPPSALHLVWVPFGGPRVLLAYLVLPGWIGHQSQKLLFATKQVFPKLHSRAGRCQLGQLRGPGLASLRCRRICSGVWAKGVSAKAVGQVGRPVALDVPCFFAGLQSSLYVPKHDRTKRKLNYRPKRRCSGSHKFLLTFSAKGICDRNLCLSDFPLKGSTTVPGTSSDHGTGLSHKPEVVGSSLWFPFESMAHPYLAVGQKKVPKMETWYIETMTKACGPLVVKF